MKYQQYITNQKSYSLNKHKKNNNANFIDLTIGDPQDDTFPPVYQALKDISQTNSQYPTSNGSLQYREAISKWAKQEYQTFYSAQTQIISCNGTKEAIFHLPLLFDWSNNKKIFIPEISYPVYENASKILNIPIVKLPVSKETNFFPSLNSISKQQWQQCQIFFINSPHNPTSAVASKQYFEQLLQKATQYNFLVCSDECYNDIYYTEKKPTSALQFPQNKNWVVLRSLSKRSHMTGFRIGAIISANEELIANYTRLRVPMGVGTAPFIQKAAIKAWEDSSHPQQFAKQYRQKRDIIKDILQKQGFEIFGAEASFYLWFRHPNIDNCQTLVNKFLEKGIAITPGNAFGKATQPWCRLVYCITQKTMQSLVKRLKNIL